MMAKYLLPLARYSYKHCAVLIIIIIIIYQRKWDHCIHVVLPTATRGVAIGAKEKQNSGRNCGNCEEQLTSTDCRPTVGRQWADSFFHSFSDLLADSR